MFRLPTLFILGAGASAPYNFPIARKLVRDIIDKSRKTPRYLENVQREIGALQDKFREMAEQLYLSHAPSIDLWLESREEFLNVGKIAIARELIEVENPSYIEGTRDKNWYADLFHTYLRPGAIKPDAITTNQVRFISFNYDRSLEYTLFSLLKANYGVDDDGAAAIVNQIPILHVYGQLGRLPWQSQIDGISTEREYKAVAGWDVAKKHADDIDVFSEGKFSSRTFDIAHQWIREARYIYFTGFAYHQINLQRLNPGHELRTVVMGSAYQLAPRLRQFLEKNDNPFGTRIALGADNWDASAFLENCVRIE